MKKTLSAAPIRGILYPTEIGGEEAFGVRTSFRPAAAPVAASDPIGTATLFLNGTAVCSVPIVATETVEAAGFGYYLKKAVGDFIG